ncbi:MAG TPA: guanylate kinase [Candidatus Mediterraneibacter guildfordensis]|nr:guanylate kinase [Candidatus Mediterraneibacter guildfordensis]
MGKIYYVMGKSCSGKDTIYRRLTERHPELRVVVPYTTRPIREGEQDGVEYFFVDREKMEEMQAAGRIIELRSYNTVLGVWNYFTADDGQIDLASHSYLIIGTLVSYEAMRDYYGAEALVPIYVEVEDGTRLERAIGRERKQAKPQYEEMCRRFLADAEDFSEEKLCRAGITKRFVNTDLEQCLKEIETFIR